MNQDNNQEFELSGTLGNLNDIPNNNELNNDSLTIMPEVNEIEMLDVEIKPEEQVNMTQDNQMINQNINLNEVPNNNSLDQNLNPIPNSFEIGDIGSVPPIDPTGKGEKKSKGKKVLFTILIIIIIFGIGAMVYYYLHISRNSIGNAVIPKELSFEIGEDIPTDINEYATFKSISSNNCILNTNNVDTSKVGEYEYKITCGNNVYTGKIYLKDSKGPEVETKTIVKKINDPIAPEEFIKECKEKGECNYAFENVDTVTNYMQQAGNYDLNIIVTDPNNNVSTIPVKLIVIDKDIKVYLNCVQAEQSNEEFKGNVSSITKIGISEDSQYVGLYFKIKEYILTTEEEYNKIKNNYIENKVLDVNNGEGTPIFDDDNLTISFEEIMSGEAEFGTDYSSIKNYYETTQNYKCNIMSVN